jgi:hypothetical protein
MANNRFLDKEGRYPIKPVTVETVDGAVYDFFDKKLDLSVDGPSGKADVKVLFAGHERWAQIRKNGFRDEHGVLVLPIISIRRMDISRQPTLGGPTSAQKSLTVSRKIHPKTPFVQSIYETRRANGFLATPEKAEPIYETLTIPFPDYAIVNYEISIWTQHNTQMNDILEAIFYNYQNVGGRVDSIVMPVEYEGKKPKGDSYYFVAFPDTTLGKQSNDEDFTDQERIIRYGLTMQVPAYFILDPDSETLSYGEDNDGNSIVYKKQNANQVRLKESIVSFEEFEKLFG